jgi:hypothetical protein
MINRFEMCDSFGRLVTSGNKFWLLSVKTTSDGISLAFVFLKNGFS